jgi:RHS repeat-associated protein
VLTSSGALRNINPIRYRGYYYDTETGLYYLKSRYYDPEVGRFINADVLADADRGSAGLNLFAYCLDDPVNNLDSEGFYTNAIGISWSIASGPRISGGIQFVLDDKGNNSLLYYEGTGEGSLSAGIGFTYTFTTANSVYDLESWSGVTGSSNSLLGVEVITGDKWVGISVSKGASIVIVNNEFHSEVTNTTTIVALQRSSILDYPYTPYYSVE